MEPNRKLILGVLHSYKYRKTNDRPVDVIDEDDFNAIVDQILSILQPKVDIAPPLQQADVSRSAKFNELFRQLTKVVDAAYCELDKGEADEWFDKAKEKIVIFQALNSVP